MTAKGWRILQINEKSHVGFSDSRVVVEKDEETVEIPIEQLACVMINSQQIAITVKLVEELADRNISLVFCDKKHLPTCEVMPYHAHTYSAGNIIKQASWEKKRKDTLWLQIVNNKIQMQDSTLMLCGGESQLEKFISSNTLFNDTNEAKAAKVYFHRLFGMEFSRDDECITNAALNYGYSILLSLANRIISSHGYNSSLGIHHYSMANPFNLGCDFMEPFRPVVDRFVFGSEAQRELTLDYRNKLISLQYESVRYNDNQFMLQDAMEVYIMDGVKFMNGESDVIGEIKYAE